MNYAWSCMLRPPRGMDMSRTAEVSRKTRETQLRVRVDLDGTGQLLDPNTKGPEILPEPARELGYQRARRRDVGHPSILGIKLVQGLKHAKLSKCGLPCGCGQVHDHRPARLVEKPLELTARATVQIEPATILRDAACSQCRMTSRPAS